MDSPFVAIDPTTGRELSRHPLLDQAEVERRLTAAVTAQQAWARQPPAARASGVAGLGAALRRDAADHAGLITAEMGKPLAEARAEVEKCARACVHYATHGPSLLADEEVATEAGRSGVTCQPLGVVLAIMPWNFPYWQVIRFLAPAL